MTEPLLDPQQLSELIGAIYDCALDPSLWEPTLEKIIDVLDCSVASLTLNDVRRGEFLINRAAGWDAALLQKKSESHVPEINARLTEWLAQQPSLDLPFVTSRHLTREYIERSEYVRECLAPQGIVDIMHVFLMYTPTQFAEIGLGRHARQGIITPREVEFGRLLLPHLRRSVTISNVLETKTIEHARLAEVIDSLDCGVLLTDERGAILHANLMGREILKSRETVSERGGIITTASPHAARTLRRSIAAAALRPTDIGDAGIAIHLAPRGSTPFVAHVLPLRHSGIRHSLLTDAVAAVFLRTPDNGGSAEALAAAFDLTSAELRVADSLLDGRSLSETATFLEIARSTAKSHLDHIFAKTGVSRQTELIRLAMQLNIPVRNARPKA